MSDHVLERRQLVPGTPERVFEFFKDPYNLERITPPWLRFEVRAASDARVREGTRIRYRLAWQGIPMRWESRITDFRAGREFVDEMTRGPYARWHHRHLFTKVEGGVEMRDVVTYRLPLGPLGRLAHALVVRRQLEAIFDYRRRVVAEVFGGERAGSALERVA
ncbi:MAG: SRPBCC family protein [Gemmatimonadales bacterium]